MTDHESTTPLSPPVASLTNIASTCPLGGLVYCALSLCGGTSSAVKAMLYPLGSSFTSKIKPSEESRTVSPSVLTKPITVPGVVGDPVTTIAPSRRKASNSCRRVTMSLAAAS